jgi:hypothetical protein
MYGYKEDNLKYPEFRDSIARDCDKYMIVQDPNDMTWYNVYIGDTIVVKHRDFYDDYKVKVKHF